MGFLAGVAPALLYFLTGVLATIIASKIILKRPFRSKSLTQESSEITEDSNAQVTVEHQAEKPRSETLTTRSFDFRERLWNEPPELGYERYEIYDAVQKELKVANVLAGNDLAWQTSWLDLFIERGLLAYYSEWLRNTSATVLNSQEGSFYDGLLRNLNDDWDEIMEDQERVNGQYGKSWEEVEDLERFIHMMRTKDWRERGIEWPEHLDMERYELTPASSADDLESLSGRQL